MAVSPEFRAYVLDLLRPLGRGAARSMFGGAGLYLDGTMFGLMTRRDALYFRTDAGNRGDFEAAGMGPFVPFEDGRMTMPYHEVPAHIMEDAEEMCAWARRAWEAACQARNRAKTTGRRERKAK